MYTEKHIFDWDEADVQQWLIGLGYTHCERHIKEHKIRGDTLCLLDFEGLKTIGIPSVGQRLSILKAIYDLKVVHNVEFGEDDYVPPSENVEKVSLKLLHTKVVDQGKRLRFLEEDMMTINNAMQSFLDEIKKLRLSIGLPEEENINPKIPRSRNDIDNAALYSAVVPCYEKTPPHSQNSMITNAVPTPMTASTGTSDTTKVSLDDPTWKVLPAALKKHRINIEEWPNYYMFITFGPPSNRTKRRLEPNEKPLYLFKKLKDAKKNPAFVLKNMRDLSSKTQGLQSSSPKSQSSLQNSPNSNNHISSFQTMN